jgi:hypothetical protein
MKGKAALESQLKLYTIMAVLKSMFGSETLTVRKYHETAEMKFLREVI